MKMLEYSKMILDKVSFDKLLFEKELLKPNGWLVLEHTPRNDYKKFNHYKTERGYGTTIFSIFVNNWVRANLISPDKILSVNLL